MVQPLLQNTTETPAIPAAQKAVGKSALSRMIEKNQETQYNIFLKMFLAQVKHQSVDNPMSTHEMTQSVMSFMQAAEHTQTNKLLKQANDMKVKEQISMARGYLNKEVDYLGDVIGFEGGPQKIAYEIPENIKGAQLQIIDAKTDTIVYQKDLEVKAGKYNTTWAGEMMDRAKTAEPGQYIVHIAALDKADTKLSLDTTLQGRVRGITFDEEENEHFLVVNNDVVIRMNDVISERKVASKDYLNLSEKLDNQIRHYEELTKLIGEKFNIDLLPKISAENFDEMPGLVEIANQTASETIVKNLETTVS